MLLTSSALSWTDRGMGRRVGRTLFDFQKKEERGIRYNGPATHLPIGAASPQTAEILMQLNGDISLLIHLAPLTHHGSPTE